MNAVIEHKKEKVESISVEPSCELTILMPCLNEAETLGTCIDKAHGFVEIHEVKAEIIVADNGSTDGSQKIAKERGARVVNVKRKGYGSALLGGIAASRGRYVIMGDSDNSYDFSNLMPLLQELRIGYELVMGNRFLGGITHGAMPALHQYLGNPVLTGIGKLLFKNNLGDFHCGLRGFNKAAIDKLDLQSTGMEFASEMVVKATLKGLRISEVPTILSPDGRSRPPHLRSWRDGWRHLRFLVIFSPRWLFYYPGLAMLLAGILSMAWLSPSPRQIGGIEFDIHTMLYAAAAIILGLQSISFALFSRFYGSIAGFLPPSDKLASLVQRLSLERGIFAGILLVVAGLGGSIYAFTTWEEQSFGTLIPSRMMRLIIPAFTSLVAGIQITLSAFFLSVIKIPSRRFNIAVDPEL